MKIKDIPVAFLEIAPMINPNPTACDRMDGHG